MIPMDPPSWPRILPALGDPALFSSQWPTTPYRSVGSAKSLEALLTWDNIDRIINDRTIQAPAFRMVQDNQLISQDFLCRPEEATSLGLTGLMDPARMVSALAGGATLVLQGLNRFWPPLGDLCRRLSSEIGHPVFANAYLTPSAARGFGAHRDPYHAWLAQAEGSKNWRLWAPDADHATDQPTLEVTLEKGDVLWIPRGWWHSGASIDTPSLHLTLTVWATKTEDVLRVILASLSDSAAMKRELPPNALAGDESAIAEVATAVTEIFQLMSALDISELAGRLIGARRQRFAPLPVPPVAEVLGERQSRSFHVHPEGILHWTADPEGAIIGTADALVMVPPEYVAPCERLLAGAGATIRRDELAEFDQGLLENLIQARLLCTASHEVPPTP
ncbi:cupin superfamily protein [Nonomuraea polychroma]|uniref:Cupin superfamily protein n=1 Tax=Nonomuraea polychroma TaxID=46176 RepID=A0A438LXY2_9ACTN|nr:cupin superfamily protein [Nonomuraea polychroma]